MLPKQSILLAAAVFLLPCFGTRSDERFAFVTVLPQYDLEVQLVLEGRTCRNVSWPDSHALPEDGSIWRLRLDTDCKIVSVVEPIDVTTMKRRRWIEKIYTTRTACNVDQLTPLVLKRCRYIEDADAFYGISASVINVGGSIDPHLHRQLKTGERCAFSMSRLTWGEEGYLPLAADWLTAYIIGVECPYMS